MVNWPALDLQMSSWRQDLHKHPEFGFDEHRTSSFVASKLREFNFDSVVEGVGRTGVVGTLKRGTSGRSIAIRADMDALQIYEQGPVSYKSVNDGIMHACGHDALSEEGGFDGTVQFIFQPAEEWGLGALTMLADGLIERFPFQEIYGIHNMPGIPIGSFHVRPGTMMSAEDIFHITLKGVGGHASRPDAGCETLVPACALVTSLQTIVSRRVDPADVAVVSVTEIKTDGARNVLPGFTKILGDVRSFKPEVSAMVEKQIRTISDGIASAYNVSAEVEYRREFVPVINDPELTSQVVLAAQSVFGATNVAIEQSPMTVSEDFAQFLSHVPGCFAFVGNGPSAPLHNPNYDFNDAALTTGAAFHCAVVRHRLAP
jgi:amidohydrolase